MNTPSSVSPGQIQPAASQFSGEQASLELAARITARSEQSKCDKEEKDLDAHLNLFLFLLALPYVRETCSLGKVMWCRTSFPYLMAISTDLLRPESPRAVMGHLILYDTI